MRPEFRLVDHLEYTGRLRTLPFDASACQRATMEDIDPQRVSTFLRTARRERQFVLKATTPTEAALTHLRLLDQGRPSHAAILLFGRDPQRFLPTAEMKCMHFHGTQVAKPIPSYQIYKGDVFQQVDEAVDFVMAKVNRSVGTRALSTQAPVEYEFSKELLTEAVMEQLGLTPRQKTCLYHVKSAGRITSTDYQRLTGVSRQTAARDLSDLVEKPLLVLRGHGRGAYYAIAQRTPKK